MDVDSGTQIPQVKKYDSNKKCGKYVFFLKKTIPNSTAYFLPNRHVETNSL